MSLNPNRDLSLPLSQPQPSQQAGSNLPVLVSKKPLKPLKKVAGFSWDSKKHPVAIKHVAVSLANFGARQSEEPFRRPAWRFSFRAEAAREQDDAYAPTLRSAGLRMRGQVSRGRAQLAPLRLALLGEADRLFDPTGCVKIQKL